MSTKGSLSVEASSSEERQGILFVAAFCGLQEGLTVQDGAELQLVAPDGQTYTTYTSVQDWLSFRNSELSGLSEQQLLKVNDRLQTKVYLAGPHVTLADLVLFTTLHRALVNIPRAQITERYPSLFRWFDFLQHTVDFDSQYTKLDIRKPKFQRAPPAPAPAPKVEKPKADEAKAAKASKGSAASSSSAATAIAAPVSDGDSKAAAEPAVSSASGSQAQQPAKAAAASAVADGNAPKEAVKKDAATGKKGKAKEAPAGKKDAGEPTVDLLDIRVGQIVKVAQHPNADALYVEDIDLGEDKPRQVVSGLVKFMPEDQMQNRHVVVVTNLKPAKMRDVMSYGMVLCASNDAHDQVEPILPPEGVPLGEKITFEGYAGEPEAQLNPKKKIFEKISPDLKTNADGAVCYRDVQFMTSKGPVSSSIKNAAVK